MVLLLVSLLIPLLGTGTGTGVLIVVSIDPAGGLSSFLTPPTPSRPNTMFASFDVSLDVSLGYQRKTIDA